MWMPSMRASRAAGSSVASWNSAVERAWPGWMPRSLRRCPRWVALIGRPGCPPGIGPFQSRPRVQHVESRILGFGTERAHVGQVRTFLHIIAPKKFLVSAGGMVWVNGHDLYHAAGSIIHFLYDPCALRMNLIGDIVPPRQPGGGMVRARRRVLVSISWCRQGPTPRTLG